MSFPCLCDVLNQLTQFTWTSCILLITVCILVHRTFFTTAYTTSLPPSPGYRLPVIGHLYLLGSDLRIHLRKFRKQLGDVYSLYYGGRLGVVISGYETMKEAFLKNGDVFADRPILYISEIASRGTGIVLANGQRWKEHRRFTLSTLKEFGMGKSILEEKVHSEVEVFLSEIRNFKGESFDPKEIICTHIANIICSIVFRGGFTHGDERFLAMLQIIDENMELAAGLANLVPWIAKIPGDPFNCKKIIRNADKMFDYCQDIIDDHVMHYDENVIGDLTSAYIKEMKRMESIGQETTMNFSQLTGLIGDLFVGGSHTTSAALRWAIPCLVQFPDVQNKLYEEISGKIGTERLPSVQDKTTLGYLEAFYLEVLRYCNITIVSGLHSTTRDITFKGYTIPKDALIIPDLDSVFNDPEIWQDPENFRPERFLDDEGNIRKREEMIAFFLGKRNCIGESLARMELMLFIGALVQRYQLESPVNETLTVENVDGVFGMVHAPKPYTVVAKLRE